MLAGSGAGCKPSNLNALALSKTNIPISNKHSFLLLATTLNAKQLLVPQRSTQTPKPKPTKQYRYKYKSAPTQAPLLMPMKQTPQPRTPPPFTLLRPPGRHAVRSHSRSLIPATGSRSPTEPIPQTAALPQTMACLRALGRRRRGGSVVRGRWRNVRAMPCIQRCSL